MNSPFVRPIGIHSILEEIDSQIENVGEWVKSGAPAPGSVGAVVQSRLRQVCDDWSRYPEWVQGLPSTAARQTSDVCKPYLESLGSGDPQLSSPMFTGGQCPGVLYRVVVSGVRVFKNGFQSPYSSTLTNRTGPILFVGRQDTATQARVVVTASPPSGTTIVVTESLSSIASISINTTVTRMDNAPDTCGNPPSPIVPNPNPRPDPRTDPLYEPPDVTNPERPIIPLPDITDPFGRLVELPGVLLDPWWSPSNVGAGGTDGNPNPGEPGVSVDTGQGDVAEGEAPEGQRLTGVEVEVLSAPMNARRVQNVVDPPYIGACYVRMGYEGLLSLDPAGQLLGSGDFFVAPPDSTHWQVQATLGYNLRITPHYATGEIENV